MRSARPLKCSTEPKNRRDTCADRRTSHAPDRSGPVGDERVNIRGADARHESRNDASVLLWIR